MAYHIIRLITLWMASFDGHSRRKLNESMSKAKALADAPRTNLNLRDACELPRVVTDLLWDSPLVPCLGFFSVLEPFLYQYI